MVVPADMARLAVGEVKAVMVAEGARADMEEGEAMEAEEEMAVEKRKPQPNTVAEVVGRSRWQRSIRWRIRWWSIWWWRIWWPRLWDGSVELRKAHRSRAE
jgi:hypothetical protein